MAATRFHFTRDTPTESVLNDIQTLNKFNDEQFKQLTSIVVTFLSNPTKSTWLTEQLDEFAGENGVNAGSLKNVVKGLLSVLTSCLRLNLDADLVRQDLVLLGLNEERAGKFGLTWKEHQVAMTKGTLSQTLSVNHLVDMEWKFGVTAASSELKKVGSTFLQLKLVIDKGNARENVYMELTLPQFYSFLHEMEKARSSMEFLS